MDPIENGYAPHVAAEAPREETYGGKVKELGGRTIDECDGGLTLTHSARALQGQGVLGEGSLMARGGEDRTEGG